MVENVNAFLKAITPIAASVGIDNPLVAGVSMLGRVALRQLETKYVAQLMLDWTEELIEICKGGTSEDLLGTMAEREGISGKEFASTDVDSYFTDPVTKTGAGPGFWEAPRGALYHAEKVTNGSIDGYQIIIPTTWNLAPRAEDGTPGPIEQALIGCPVEDIEKPLNALRLVHSYDPCVSCAVHVSEPATGKHFETVTNPWGVK